MSWSWQLEKRDGTVMTERGLPRESFGSQGDAESWIGENWRALLEAGVDQVTLLEDGRPEYGPMSLHPADPAAPADPADPAEPGEPGPDGSAGTARPAARPGS